jgi:hypothetical protein
VGRGIVFEVHQNPALSAWLALQSLAQVADFLVAVFVRPAASGVQGLGIRELFCCCI